MFNLGTVYTFEVVRTLKKKSFWITALMFPILMIVIGGIMYYSNKATNEAADKMKNATFSIIMTDESQAISPRYVETLKIQAATSKEQGIEAVKTGKVDAYFYYPSDLATQSVEVYGKNVGIFDNDKYQAVAKYLLTESIAAGVNTNVSNVLRGNTRFMTTTYQNGAVYDGLQRAIFPGLFLVLFYFLIAMFGGQMLTSTTEEKENRVMEMILTTVAARTLIVGKILSLITLAFVQGLIVATPVAVAYFFFREQLAIPAIDLTAIPVDPGRILTGAALFASSFFLFTGLLVMIGAASPTAKEASNFLGIVMTLLFAPLYAFALYLSAPDSLIVRILTYFPLTAPIPSLMRNAVGNLSPSEAILVIAILGISAIIVMFFAIRMFKYGAIEYSKKLSPRMLFKK